MGKIILCVVIGMLGYIPLLKAEEETKNPELDARIAKLVKQLDADDIKAREEAVESLKKIGKPALPALEQAAQSDNPEVAWRAKIVIKAINKLEARKDKPDKSKEQPFSIGPSVKQFSNNFSISIRGGGPGTRSMSIVRDANGKVTVTITEYKDGKEVTNTYTADSIEEFKTKYPDIAKEYGIGIEEKTDMNERFVQPPEIDLDDIWEDFGNLWSRRWGDMQKEMDRMRETMKDWQPHIRIRPAPEPDEPEEQPDEPAEDKADSPSSGRKYELGVEVEFIDAALRSQLNLNDAGGVIARAVKADSVAEKMGLKTHDVILSINGAGITTIWEFRRIIKGLMENDKKIKLEIIRQGKKQVIESG